MEGSLELEALALLWAMSDLHDEDLLLFPHEKDVDKPVSEKKRSKGRQQSR